MKKILLLIMIFIIMIPMNVYAVEMEIVIDENFETDNNGDGLADDWTKQTTGTLSSTNSLRYGEQRLIINSTSGQGDVKIRKDIAVNSGEYLNIGLIAKITNKQDYLGFAYIQFRNATSQLIGEKLLYFVNEEYVNIKAENVLAPDGTTWAQVAIGLSANKLTTAYGNLYIETIQLIKGIDAFNTYDDENEQKIEEEYENTENKIQEQLGMNPFKNTIERLYSLRDGDYHDFAPEVKINFSWFNEMWETNDLPDQEVTVVNFDGLTTFEILGTPFVDYIRNIIGGFQYAWLGIWLYRRKMEGQQYVG